MTPDLYDVERSFLAFAESQGFFISESLKLDGKIHRFKLGGDRGGERSGAYCLWPEGKNYDGKPHGWVQDHHEGGDKHFWQFYSRDNPPPREKPTAEERTVARARREAEERKEAENRVSATKQAHETWQAATEIESGKHPYLVRKGVKPYGDMRTSADGSRLILPWRDIITGDIATVQYIADDGRKRWYNGALKHGGYLIAPDVAEGPCVICEGAATACSVYEALSETGPVAVIAAGDAGSLRHATEAAHKRWPGRAVYIAADDDLQREQETGRNPGIDSARAIRQAGLIDGVLVPPFPRESGAGDKRSDWNDFAQDFGIETTRRVLNDMIRASAASFPDNARPALEYAEPPDFGDASLDALISAENNFSLINFGCERNDSGNAQRLVDAYGDDIRYCHPWRKWLAWDGRRWDADALYIVTRHAEDVVSRMLQDALAIPKSEDKDVEKERKAAVGFVISSGNNARIRAMMEIAQSGDMVPVDEEQFDKNKFLLNCENGTLDLRTGELRTFERADYITKMINLPYVPEAKCPLWGQFLFKVMGGKRHLAEFLQRVIGYCLTGDTSEQCMFVNRQ